MLPDLWLPMEDLNADGIRPGVLIELMLKDASKIVGIVMEHPKIHTGGISSVALLLGDRVVSLEHSEYSHSLNTGCVPLWAIWKQHWESDSAWTVDHALMPIECRLRVSHED